MSLFWRISLPIMTLLILLISAAMFLSYRQSAIALEHAVIDNMRGEAHSLKRMITYILDETVISLDRTSNAENFQRFFQELEAGHINHAQQQLINMQLGKMVEEQRTISRFNVFNARGVIVASSLQKALGNNFENHEYFTEAMAGKVHISKPFQSAITGQGMIIISAPVRQNGQVIGALSAVLTLENLHELAL